MLKTRKMQVAGWTVRLAISGYLRGKSLIGRCGYCLYDVSKLATSCHRRLQIRFSKIEQAWVSSSSSSSAFAKAMTNSTNAAIIMQRT